MKDFMIYVVGLLVLASLVNAGTVAFYEFDGNFDDSSGYANHGTGYNDISATDSLLLDGIDDYIVVPSSPSLKITGQITIEALIKPRDTGTLSLTIARKMLQHADPGGYLLRLHRVEPGDPLFLELALKIENQDFVYINAPNFPILLDEWSHVKGIYDGNHMRLYINGNLVAEKDQTGNIITSDTPLCIGRLAYNYDLEYFSGNIDDLIISNTSEPYSIQQIVYFINSSINNSTLYPVKDGKSGEGQLNALVSMLWTASDLLDANLLEDACGQLSAVLAKTDGLEPPASAPDFVAGPSAPQLAAMLEALIISLGCE